MSAKQARSGVTSITRQGYGKHDMSNEIDAHLQQDEAAYIARQQQYLRTFGPGDRSNQFGGLLDH